MSIAAFPSAVSIDRSKSNAVLPFVAALCIVAALVGRGVYLCRPFDHDASMFIYLGKSVCDGDRFCHDIVDNKFPTVGLVTSIFWRMFGDHWAPYILSQTALSLIACLLLTRCARRLVGPHATLPTMLAALVYLNLTPCVFGGFQLETVQIVFATISACAALEWLHRGTNADVFLAGLAAGCAALLKPTGLSPLAALVLTALIDYSVFQPRASARWFSAISSKGTNKTSGLKAAAACVGIVIAFLATMIPISLGLLYVLRQNLWADMPTLAKQISDYASNTPVILSEDIFKPLTVLAAAGFGVFVRGWVYRREEHREGTAAAASFMTFCTIWFFLELAGALAQRRMYAYHFLPVAPPAALLLGMWPRKVEPLPLLMALAPVLALSLASAEQTLQYPDPRTPHLPVSDYIAARTIAGDSVWMDSTPRLLLETGLKPGSRYPLMFVLGNTDTAPLEYAPAIIRDFEQRRPKYVVLPTDLPNRLADDHKYILHLARSPARFENYSTAWHMIYDFVQQHYTLEAHIRGDSVYRIR